MELVQSRWFGDCTICSIAMITGQSYETIEAAVQDQLIDYNGFRFVPQRAVYLIILQYNIVPGAVIQPAPNEAVNLLKEDEMIVTFTYRQPALVTVPGSKGMLHYIVWDGERRMFLDPNYDEPMPAEVYQDHIIEWVPITNIACNHKAVYDHDAKVARCIVCKETVAVKVGGKYILPNGLKAGDSIEILADDMPDDQDITKLFRYEDDGDDSVGS